MSGKLEHATFHCGSAKERLQDIESESIQCCITSPPYWGLRDYDAEGQLGLEPTPKKYIENLVEVFEEVWRVLHPDGTFWLNLGDSYLNNPIDGYEKQKDLVGIPWRVATALQKDGWYLRSDIIWRKLGTMPSSIKDRPTPSHEYIFLLAKNKSYYYDHEAIKEPVTSSAAQKFSPEGKPKKSKRDVWEVSTGASDFGHFAVFPLDLIEPCVKAGTSAFGQCKNCGAPYKRVLEENKVKRKREERFTESKFQNAGGRRGCSQDHLGTTSETIGWESTCECGGEETERQTVLDPFAGASTTGIAALKHDRKFVGVEINPDYIELSKDRIREHEEVPANHSFW